MQVHLNNTSSYSTLILFLFLFLCILWCTCPLFCNLGSWSVSDYYFQHRHGVRRLSTLCTCCCLFVAIISTSMASFRIFLCSAMGYLHCPNQYLTPIPTLSTLDPHPPYPSQTHTPPPNSQTRTPNAFPQNTPCFPHPLSLQLPTSFPLFKTRADPNKTTDSTDHFPLPYYDG